MHGIIVCAFNLIFHPPRNSYTFRFLLLLLLLLLLISKLTLEIRISGGGGKYIQSDFRVVHSGHQTYSCFEAKSVKVFAKPYQEL